MILDQLNDYVLTQDMSLVVILSKNVNVLICLIRSFLHHW